MNKQQSQKIEKKVAAILAKYLNNKSKVVVGVSGGPDSVFLLKLLQKSPAKIIVAHVNHLLRGKESQKDEIFVKKLAPHVEIKKVDIGKLSKKLKLGIEETGRKERYDFFLKLAKKYQANFIVTAHQADDNLETIILNFTRGASLEGLSGTKEKEGILLRPLLSFSKKQILDYLNFHKIDFRIDKSNSDTQYRRNLIRHHVIPELQKINPSVIETISANTENLREISNFLRTEALKWIKKNQLDKNSFSIKTFRTLHLALQKEIIMQIYKAKNKSLQNIEKKHLSEIIELINKNIGNKRKKFGKVVFYLKENILKILAE